MVSNAVPNLPLSQIIRAKDVEEPKKKTREDWRKAKELEEARKAGTAPAAVDEEGRDINPHIPQYISQAPWYFGSAGPTLKHQRPQPEREKQYSLFDEWYSRGQKGKAATRYRKGACENCGAMTHKKKDCMERPRKVGARFTGDDIAYDEAPQPTLSLDYDGKRDRWNGYDPEEHNTIIEQYAKVEDAKRQLKAEKLKTDLGTSENISESVKDLDSDADEDEDKYVDDVDMPGTKVDSKQRITVRNLRIREDTAKYLRNLDPDSAYYDPKTRSMRDNPYLKAATNPEEVQFAGDNFIRYTGDTTKHAKAQLFAWEAYEKGVDVHLLAEPTKLELLNLEFAKRKDTFKHNVKEGILEKYGGAEHLDAPPKELLLAQTENYVEYSKHGKVIRGQEKPIIRSKYEEDVYINNHSTVWGSFWKDGLWGYKCCYSFVKNSYCAGDTGKAALLDGETITLEPGVNASDEEEEIEEPKSLLEQHVEKLEKMKLMQKAKDKYRKSSDSDSDEEEKKMRTLKEALAKETENQDKSKWLKALDDRKRPYNSMYNVKGPTDEEMEAYYMKKRRDDDPMAAFMDKN